MLDGRGEILLNRINELCRDGHYKVVERADLLSAFPFTLGQGTEGLDGLLDHLVDRGYIDVRYADRESGVYCLHPLPSGRMYVEGMRAEEREKKKKFLFFCLAAWLGGAFGSGMVALFAAIW